jgi:uncharacterized protein YdeI (YjbR/CyaY-like superfamily)
LRCFIFGADTSLAAHDCGGAHVGAAARAMQEPRAAPEVQFALMATSKATFFRSPAEFRRWLARHHARAPELLVGFYKTGCGRPSITWPESVDEALCFGWIDGVRRGVDELRYTIRFTPRRAGSIWSAINTARVRALTAAGRMAAAGLTAFEARKPNRSGRYSYEQRPQELVAPYSTLLARNPAARKFFARQIPSYRRAATWWVLSAKQEETRLRRARTLIELSARGELVPQFTRRGGSKRAARQRPPRQKYGPNTRG